MRLFKHLHSGTGSFVLQLQTLEMFEKKSESPCDGDDENDKDTRKHDSLSNEDFKTAVSFSP